MSGFSIADALKFTKIFSSEALGMLSELMQFAANKPDPSSWLIKAITVIAKKEGIPLDK